MIFQFVYQVMFIRNSEKRIIKENGGISLLSTAILMTYNGLYSVIFCFKLFSKIPNWFILTPILIFTWYIITHTDKNFKGGALHWGALVGSILFAYFT